MQWILVCSTEFEAWLNAQTEALQDATLTNLRILEEFGPTLGRPKVDTLKGSNLKNLKELRFEFDRAPIRVLFAFDPNRQALIILAGDKSSDKRWYEKSIPTAEKIFLRHITQLKIDEGKVRKIGDDEKEERP